MGPSHLCCNWPTGGSGYFNKSLSLKSNDGNGAAKHRNRMTQILFPWRQDPWIPLTSAVIGLRGLPWTNTDNAGPIVLHPMGLSITAGCDTAWIRTKDCSDAVSAHSLQLFHVSLVYKILFCLYNCSNNG